MSTMYGLQSRMCMYFLLSVVVSPGLRCVWSSNIILEQEEKETTRIDKT